ncbi:MAG: DUF998 domain-containing protein [Candidatus Methanomethylophilaceae archaeon]|jgi:hypothetical membrane protein
MNSEKKSSAFYPMLGIIAVFTFLIAWLFAIADNASWIFGEDMIHVLRTSDSGNYLVFGLAASGILLAISSIGKITGGEGRYARTAEGVLLLVAGITMVWIGFFDHGENIHTYAAILACFSFAAAMIASLIDDFGKNRHMVWGSVTLIIIAMMAASYITHADAKVQMAEILGVLIWTALRCVKGFTE